MGRCEVKENMLYLLRLSGIEAEMGKVCWGRRSRPGSREGNGSFRMMKAKGRTKRCA